MTSSHEYSLGAAGPQETIAAWFGNVTNKLVGALSRPGQPHRYTVMIMMVSWFL